MRGKIHGLSPESKRKINPNYKYSAGLVPSVILLVNNWFKTGFFLPVDSTTLSWYSITHM